MGNDVFQAEAANFRVKWKSHFSGKGAGSLVLEITQSQKVAFFIGCRCHPTPVR